MYAVDVSWKPEDPPLCALGAVVPLSDNQMSPMTVYLIGAAVKMPDSHIGPLGAAVTMSDNQISPLGAAVKMPRDA